MLARPPLDRDTHRALVEAGYAPLHEYVGRYDMSEEVPATADPVPAMLESPETLSGALDLVQIGSPYRSYPGTGGIWCGHNNGIAQATFDDWGLARATTIILNAAPHLAALVAENERLRSALREVVDAYEAIILRDEEPERPAEVWLEAARAALGDQP